MGAVRRIIVGVHGSLGSLQALRWAADEAQERRAPLVPVIAWVPPGGDLAERSHPSPYLRQIWQDAALKRLTDAFDECFGGVPDDLRGAAGWSAATGAGARRRRRPAGRPAGDRQRAANPVGRALHHSVGRYCLAHAKCPVVAVPPSALMDEMRHGLLPWPLRGRRVLVPDLEDPGPPRE